MVQTTFKASFLFLGEANALCGKAHSEDGVSHQQGQLGSCGVAGCSWDSLSPCWVSAGVAGVGTPTVSRGQGCLGAQWLEKDKEEL